MTSLSPQRWDRIAYLGTLLSDKSLNSKLLVFSRRIGSYANAGVQLRPSLNQSNLCVSLTVPHTQVEILQIGKTKAFMPGLGGSLSPSSEHSSLFNRRLQIGPGWTELKIHTWAPWVNMSLGSPFQTAPEARPKCPNIFVSIPTQRAILPNAQTPWAGVSRGQYPTQRANPAHCKA